MTKRCHTLTVLWVRDQNDTPNTVKIMSRVTAYPTIEWIRNRAADRAPLSRVPHAAPMRPMDHASGLATETASCLRGVLRQEIEVHADEWVATPDGEMPVDIILTCGARRIAVCLGPAYCGSGRNQDALVLVYGGYDALHRIRTGRGREAAIDIAHLLMAIHPTWFSNVGSLSLGRRSTQEMVLGCMMGIGSLVKGTAVAGVYLDSMRLHVASDWVHAFEEALRGGAAPQITAA